MESFEIKGHWKQIRGKAKSWWGKLTDDDLDVIDGKYEQLVGRLQIRYGITKKKAAREINKRLSELQMSPGIKKEGDKVQK